MNQLDKIPLSKIRVVDPWSKAPKGTLLQLSVREKTAIGMRCNYQVTNGAVDCIVIVSAENNAKFATAEDLGGPALDVSELLEIVAGNPSAFFPASKDLKPGMLFQYKGGFYMSFDALKGSGTGFVCLANDADPNLIGEQLYSLQMDKVVGVAQTTEVRQKPICCCSSPSSEKRSAQ